MRRALLLAAGFAAGSALAQAEPPAPSPTPAVSPDVEAAGAAEPAAEHDPEAPPGAETERAAEAAPVADAAIRAAVDAGNYFFGKHFEARDAAALADLYTADARVIAPGAPPAEGRAAIAAFWAEAMRGIARVRLETLAVESAGDLALEDGVVHLTGADGSESSERYLVVWKRVGRRWHLHRDIWNTGPATPSEPAASEPPAPTPAPEAAPAPGEGPVPGDATGLPEDER